jgi:hypothetical protein
MQRRKCNPNILKIKMLHFDKIELQDSGKGWTFHYLALWQAGHFCEGGKKYNIGQNIFIVMEKPIFITSQNQKY